MEFFDNALNKAREAIGIACKKTEEVVSVQKQKFDIATIENKRNKDFEKLGKLYFEVFGENETKETKNARVCPKCGAFVEDNAVFCSTCGAKIEFDSEDDENE